jgi:FAD/FMN-containing dehydrogenase
MDQGACFDRPYGDWAEMVYKRSGNYTVKLKEVKAEMDPCSIMNPGKLCFD